LRRIRVHRIPLPTSVTIAISCGGGTAPTIHNFRFSESEIFFRRGLDSGIKKQPVGQITCGKTQAKQQRNDNRGPEKPNGARERAPD
jgi:hypothetical protein